MGVDLVGMFHRPGPGLRACGWSRRPEHLASDRPFDLITCVHGLHYVGDKLGLIARAASWLAEDGLFVASLDLLNLKFADGRPSGRRMVADLRRAGLEYDRRGRLVTCRGRRIIDLHYRYLGADDRAGPNYTGQPAVDSYYEEVAKIRCGRSGAGRLLEAGRMMDENDYVSVPARREIVQEVIDGTRRRHVYVPRVRENDYVEFFAPLCSIRPTR